MRDAKNLDCRPWIGDCPASLDKTRGERSPASLDVGLREVGFRRLLESACVLNYARHSTFHQTGGHMKRFALMIACLPFCLVLPALAADAPQPRPADAPVLAHIHVYCNQLEPMIEFFVKGFDAQLVMRRKFGSDEGAVISMGAAPLYIQQSKVNAAKSGIVAYDHIGLNVLDVAVALKKALSAPGAKLDRDIHAVGVAGTAKAAFVRGPEGIRVELVQPPPKK